MKKLKIGKVYTNRHGADVQIRSQFGGAYQDQFGFNYDETGKWLARPDRDLDLRNEVRKRMILKRRPEAG